MSRRIPDGANRLGNASQPAALRAETSIGTGCEREAQGNRAAETGNAQEAKPSRPRSGQAPSGQSASMKRGSASLGQVPSIDSNPRRSAERKQESRGEAAARRAIGYEYPKGRRYHERSTAERVNARLKDEFGGRHLRVRGHAKASCHLMFGILVLTVNQLVRLAL